MRLDASVKSLEESFHQALTTSLIGQEAIIVDSTGSTNRDILEAAEKGAPEGLLICADSQQSGRGRQGRIWHSPVGKNIYVSILLRPAGMPPARIPQIAMLAALALRKAICVVIPDADISLKWPNDLWMGGHKLSGILCECGADGTIALGIGLNVNSSLEDFPEELRGIATSLHLNSPNGKVYDRGYVLAEIANAFERYYFAWLNSTDFMPFIGEWNKYDMLVGRKIVVVRPVDNLECTVLGIDCTGFLKVRATSDNRETLIAAGDVHLNFPNP